MDISNSLKIAENSLRDFIAYILQSEIGDNWVNSCGVSEERMTIWKERFEGEKKKLNNSITESRLLYFADFYDLKTILKANWSGEFSSAFGKWKTMEVFLNELEKYRNPEAHRRDILPHQKHLIIGMSEEIRNKIVRYRSIKEEKSSDDFYPRIEKVTDNLGNVWTPDKRSKRLQTNSKINIGDTLFFIISATDPLGEEIQYQLREFAGRTFQDWTSNSEIELNIGEEHVRRRLSLQLTIKSPRNYKAHKQYDDAVNFIYEVLPPI